MIKRKQKDTPDIAELKKAIEHFGSQAELARVLGITPSLLFWHLNKKSGAKEHDRLPVRYAIKLEMITHGFIDAKILAPVGLKDL